MLAAGQRIDGEKQQKKHADGGPGGLLEIGEIGCRFRKRTAGEPFDSDDQEDGEDKGSAERTSQGQCAATAALESGLSGNSFGPAGRSDTGIEKGQGVLRLSQKLRVNFIQMS